MITYLHMMRYLYIHIEVIKPSTSLNAALCNVLVETCSHIKPKHTFQLMFYFLLWDSLRSGDIVLKVVNHHGRSKSN